MIWRQEDGLRSPMKLIFNKALQAYKMVNLDGIELKGGFRNIYKYS